MSWLFSQALVEEYLVDTYLDGEQSAPLSVSATRQAYLCNVKTKDSLNHSQYGMTLGRLTERNGEGLLMWYREVFLAKTSALQEVETDLTESEVDFGRKWPVSFAKYDQISCLWRTRQHSLFGGLTEFSEIWPKWGSMRNGECYRQQMLVLRTVEKEFGFWPTPQASDNKDRGCMEDPCIQRRIAIGKQICLSRAVKEKRGPGSLNPMWVEWLMGWPLGWTDLKPLEMDKFRLWQQQHSNF